MDNNSFADQLLDEISQQSLPAESQLDQSIKNGKHSDNGDIFVANLPQQYPADSPCVSKQLTHLKRKIDLNCVNESVKSKRSRILTFQCEKCEKSFDQLKLFNRHQQTHKKLKCKFCHSFYSRIDSLKKHISLKHTVSKSQINSKSSKNQFTCKHCDFVFEDYSGLIDHISKIHPMIPQQIGHGEIKGKKEKKNASPTCCSGWHT